jgi:(1->4)-alpha-D-glucan 1-alpha-D-glucosylmutase
MGRVPGSTYRLQLHKGFPFADAAAIAGYLKALGITHVYSSPYLQAAPGSMHGYDVVDHRTVNQELGGAEGHERFCKHLGEVGLGQVLDIVPNHMSLGEQNRYWWDVLENGTNSRYASFFDIDWNPSEERLRDKVLVPVLGDQYGRVLSAGGVKIVRQGSDFVVEAAGQTFPVSPTSLSLILNRAAEYAPKESSVDTLSFVSASFARLPSPEFWDRRMILARNRDKIVLRGLLARLCAEEQAICEAIDRAVAEINANPDALDELLNQQYYRLAYWKTADQQLGYRRFFDVNTLIGLRVEREFVFDETHALILKWLKQGVLDGVRVDHPDGLRDPKQYFERLRDRAPDAWIVGEKILEPGESLRQDWPIQGTSGYDFLNLALGLLVQPAGLVRLGEHYAAFTGDITSFPTVARDKKIAVTQEALGSDVNRLASLFVDICECNRDRRDFTRAEVRRAIREVAACFAIYRTYVIPERSEITEADIHAIAYATDCAKTNRTDIDPGLFDFMHDVLTLKVTGKIETEFVYRFQQFTSPVMAKGVEDTAFYCSNRLLAMNEVGGDPDRNGLPLAHFHEVNQRIQQTFPTTMTTLSTHDTKRSDDVRARLLVLSEMPDTFVEAVRRWSQLGARHRSGDLIDTGTEWFLYQTMVGAWPISPERLRDYMQKAMREAKVRTSWVANDAAYEGALNDYIDTLLSDEAFTQDMAAFVQSILAACRINSLSQTLLKYTAPGVPDLYQGSELWDLSLVDPDNRRPVDYQLREHLLQGLVSKGTHALKGTGFSPYVESPTTAGALAPEGANAWGHQLADPNDPGQPKLWLVHRALTLRNDHPEWFGPEAAYTPLTATGQQSDRVIAYLRGECVLTIAQRWSFSAQPWADTALTIPPGTWRNRLTGELIQAGNTPIAKLLATFPVALLVREDKERPNA